MEENPHLHQYFKANSQSGGTRSYEIAKSLCSKGYEVHVVSASDHNKGLEIVDGIHVHWCKNSYSNQMNFYRRILSFIIFIFQSIKVGLPIKAELIYASSTLTIAVPTLVLSILKRIDYIFEVRDLWPEVPIAMES